jgi:tetratricopeptide (TPR) repeat protein
MHPTIWRTGVPAALFGLAFAAQAAAQQPALPPQSGKAPVQGPGKAQWALSADEARARAAAEKKLVYYEFDSPDCGNCRRMQALLYPAFDFEALLIGMIPVKVTYDSPDAKPLQERYRVSEVPSVLITTPEGRLVFLMQGFKEARDFYAHAHKDLDAYRQFARKIDGQNIDALSAEEALSTGRALYERSDPKAALPRLKRATVAPEPGPGVREVALEGLAAVEFELGDAAASRKSIERLIATTKSPEQKERAELFRAQIPLAENKPAEALALYKQFVKDHPDSQYRERVQSFITRLQTAPPAP